LREGGFVVFAHLLDFGDDNLGSGFDEIDFAKTADSDYIAYDEIADCEV
jgi:hypothetical protein